jgi:hypothetical protein
VHSMPPRSATVRSVFVVAISGMRGDCDAGGCDFRGMEREGRSKSKRVKMREGRRWRRSFRARVPRRRIGSGGCERTRVVQVRWKKRMFRYVLQEGVRRRRGVRRRSSMVVYVY